MKYWRFFIIIVALTLTLFACDRQKTICSEESLTYLDDMASFPPLSDAADITPESQPLLVEINGKMMPVDRIVTGPVCNENWSGIVYVGCDIQIAVWEEAPRFFKECNFNVEPGATIIVAPHNNESFYRGCSCHTGEDMLE